MRYLRWALPVAIFALLVSAAPGFAATRHASSTGTVSVPSACTVTAGPTACTLKNAVEGASSGDTVIVQADGTYSLTTTITISQPNLTIQPPGIQQAVLQTTTGARAFTTGSPVTVRGLNISGAASGAGVFALVFFAGPGSLIERVSVRNTGDGTIAMVAGPSATVRDSVVYGSGTSAATALVAAGTVTNVTAIAEAPFAAGIQISDSYFPGQTLQVRNSIARASVYDMAIVNQTVAADVGMVVDHSNFRGPTVFGFIVDAGGNQLAGNAQLVNFAGAADIHQQSSSPTIDAGAVNPAIGPLDFEAEARISRCGVPDIGADEFQAACPATPDKAKPVISKLKAVKKNGKLKSLTFNSSEAGKATFKYRRRKGNKFKSAGSQTKTVKAGKNAVKAKRLQKGSYRLTLTIKDAAGNVSVAKKLSFKVK